MPDQTVDAIDRALVDAGEAWRASQPSPRAIDASLFTSERGQLMPSRSARLAAFLAGAATATVALVLLALATNLAPRIGGGAGAGGSPGNGYIPTGRVNCPLTKPDPTFVPPSSYDGQPAAQWGHGWFGTNDLWTAVTPDGVVLTGLSMSDAGYTQKTFWWSDDFRVNREQIPEIYVTGRRLDGPGALRFGPGTNAGAPDIGSAMLVGVDFPTLGCWELTARYRSAELAIVVWLGE
jgi:hypothetical protein